MRVLVTGGTGLLGAAVAEKLLQNGHRPILFDVAPQFRQIEAIKNSVQVIQGNTLELPELIQAIKNKKVEAIIHTAAMNSKAAQERPYTAIRINIGGTVNVLEAARLEAIAKVVYCGSASIYDLGALRDRPVREDHPVSPATFYASTKLACENIGRNYSALYGTKFISLRFTTVYGPGYSQSGFGGFFIHPVLCAMMSGKSYQTKRPFRKINEFLYVKDAASALVQGVEKETASSTFNIGEGKLRSLDDVLGQIQKLFPEQTIQIVEGVGEDTSRLEWSFPYDISLAEKELGFKVEFPLEKALPDYIRWLRDHL